jgi:hypothetical protein
MATPTKLNLTILQGTTFNEVVRWESSKKLYKTITGITQAAPAVITSTGHTVPDGWQIKVTNVVGMKEINSTDTYRKATVLTANTIELNDINAVGYTAYVSGGIIEFYQPVDLTSYTARMQIRSKVDSATILLELTTENGGITIDNVAKTITLTITATATAALSWISGVYSLELVSGSGIVTTLINGNVTVKKEVTR